MSMNDPANTNPNLVEFERAYEGFDENLNLISKKVKGSYVTVSPVYPENATDEQKKAADAEATNKALEALNKSGAYVDAANYIIRREALREARASAGISGAINREVLMNFIKPWRDLPQYSSMIASDDKRKATGEEWNKQTAAILDAIKLIPPLVENIKILSAKANAAGAEEE